MWSQTWSGCMVPKGTSAAGTIFPQKVTGSQSPACSFKDTFYCSLINSICCHVTSTHLKICFASSDNLVTFVTKKGFWMISNSSLPTKRALKLSISFWMKSTWLGTSLSPCVCTNRSGKWTSSPWRSFFDCGYHITHCVVLSL